MILNIKDRAKQAANRLAVERGWTKAESVGERDGAERKNRIHKDAIDVLACMNKFNLERYFEGMRSRGWIIDAKYDSKESAEAILLENVSSRLMGVCLVRFLCSLRN